MHAMYKRSVCMNERVGAPPDMPFRTRMLDRDRCTNYVERARTYQAKANMFYFIIIIIAIAIYRAVSVGCRRLCTQDLDDRTVSVAPQISQQQCHSVCAMCRIWFYVSCGVAKTQKKKKKKEKKQFTRK